MVDRDIIREIQLAGLSMLHKFDEICRKYDVRYFAYDGTLLGAIRHHGYIPWDDDLDLGILREDYEKLEKVPAYEWGDDLELVSPADSEIKHDKLFPRVYLKNSRIQSYMDVRDWRDPTTNRPWHTSLMLDLYVFDTIPDDDKEYHKIFNYVHKKKNWYKASKLKCNLKVAFGPRLAKNFIKWIYGTAARAMYKEPWKKMYDEHLSRIKKGSKGKRTGTYYEQMCFDTKDLFPLEEIAFEDMTIPIPHNYVDILKTAYGDTYMQFPPEKDRYHINFIFADLTKGKIFNINPIKGSLGEAYLKNGGKQ